MSGRELVIQHVTIRMVEAFSQGNVIDAQNIAAFLASLEQMTDGEYTRVTSEEPSGAIS